MHCPQEHLVAGLSPRVHAAAVAYWPDILEYQTHTTRTFALIVLDSSPGPARPR